jgi:hypothetical protein
LNSWASILNGFIPSTGSSGIEIVFSTVALWPPGTKLGTNVGAFKFRSTLGCFSFFCLPPLPSLLRSPPFFASALLPPPPFFSSFFWFSCFFSDGCVAGAIPSSGFFLSFFWRCFPSSVAGFYYFAGSPTF